jgi:hypothetical protein
MGIPHTNYGEPMDARQARYAARAFAEDALSGINRDISQASEEQHNRRMAAAAELEAKRARDANRRIENKERLDAAKARLAARAFAGEALNRGNRDITQASERQYNMQMAAAADLDTRQAYIMARAARAARRARAPSPPANRQSTHASGNSSDVQLFDGQVPSLNDVEIATAHLYAARRGGSVPVPAQQTSSGRPSAINHPVAPRYMGRGTTSQITHVVAPSAPRTPAQSTFDKFDGPRAGPNSGYITRSSSKSAAATSTSTAMPTPQANGLDKFHGHFCDLRTPTVVSKPTTITTPTPPAPEDKDYDKLEGLPFGWRKQVPGRSGDDFHVVSGNVPSAANGSLLHPDAVMDQLDDDLASTLGWDDGDDDTDDEVEWDMGGLSEFKWVGEGSAKANSTK